MLPASIVMRCRTATRSGSCSRGGRSSSRRSGGRNDGRHRAPRLGTSVSIGLESPPILVVAVGIDEAHGERGQEAEEEHGDRWHRGGLGHG